MTDDAFLQALEQETAIQAAMLNGDPGPLISYWADGDDITVFGGWGRIEKGHQPVTDAVRWVARRFTGADAVDLEHLVIASSGDLAYTAGFEHSHVSVDGGPRRDMTLRVTHIYRRIDGAWKLAHRHADLPPPDSVRILAACRRGMASDARVLIVERLIPDDPGDAVPVLLSDLTMLVVTGGRERTNAEYGHLLAEAGLNLAKVQPVAPPYGVIEGRAPAGLRER